MPDQPRKVKTKKKKKKKAPKVKLRFRNYIPRCKELKKFMVDPASPEEILPEFTELIEQAERNDQDLSQIVPKKANWDLKRDVQPQLDKLKISTKMMIREILKERVDQNESSGSDSDSSDSGSGSGSGSGSDS